MLDWAELLRSIANIVTNDIIMEPLIAIILGYGVNLYAKNRRYQIIMDITVDVIDFIQKNYKKWGLPENEKMEKFIDIFKKEYKKHMGRLPKQHEIETAVIRADALMYRYRNHKK